MGNTTNDTYIIWIDKNVNNERNKVYQKTFESYKNIIFKCFEEVAKGIDCIKKIKFQKTIIITSGRLFPEFYHSFKACEHELYIVPNIIIFTGDAKIFYSQIDKTLPINDSFYNIGKAVDNLVNVEEFIKKTLNNYNCEFQKNEEQRIKNENLIFQTISDKNELILPIYYSKYLINTTQEQIYDFNNIILKDDESEEIIQFLFSQLVEAKNIPNNILTKFWLRAYSTHGSFNKKINEKLMNKEYKDYIPFIQKLYETANKCLYESKSEKFYKGIIVSEKDWESFLEAFQEKESDDDIPKAILYGESFLSFYTNEASVNILKKNEDKNDQYRFYFFITLILENANDNTFIKNHVHIKKDISLFETDDEILFFPFSCFEIKQIEKKKNSNEYTITLNYLDQYTMLFNKDKDNIFKNIPKNKYSELVFNSGIMDLKSIDTPDWFHKPIENNNSLNNNTNIENNLNANQNDSNNNNSISLNNISNNNMNNINNPFFNRNVKNSINCTNHEYYTNNNNFNYNYFNNINYYQNKMYQNNIQNQMYQNNIQNQMYQNNIQNQSQYIIQPNLKTIKNINDFNLFCNVSNICMSSISQNNYKNFEELKDIIQNNLINSCNGNWWINVNNQILNNFGNIEPNSVMIFQYMNIFIHIAKL